MIRYIFIAVLLNTDWSYSAISEKDDVIRGDPMQKSRISNPQTPSGSYYPQ